MRSDDDGDWEAEECLNPDSEEARYERARALAIAPGAMSPTGGLRSDLVDEVDGHLLWIGALAFLVPGPYPEGFLGGLIVADSEREDTPAITINTGVWSGPVTVMTEALARSPEVVEAGWEDVVEISVRVDQGPVYVEGGLERDTADSRRVDGHGPGWYRLRVHAANRDLEEGLEATGPWERYLVQAWPEPGCRDGCVFRENSAVSGMLDDLSEAPERTWGSDEHPRILPLAEGWVEPAPTVQFDRPQFPRATPTRWDAEDWEGRWAQEGPEEPALGLRRHYLELLLGRRVIDADPADAAALDALALRLDEAAMRRAVAAWESQTADG